MRPEYLSAEEILHRDDFNPPIEETVHKYLESFKSDIDMFNVVLKVGKTGSSALGNGRFYTPINREQDFFYYALKIGGVSVFKVEIVAGLPSIPEAPLKKVPREPVLRRERMVRRNDGWVELVEEPLPPQEGQGG